MTTFYFAYGSNLNMAQMRRRCPDAKPLGKVILPDARLIFRGVADIEFADGASVHGGLWEITKECEKALDIYEGVKNGLYRKEYITVSVTRKKRGKPEVGEALVYVMNRSHYSMPASHYYNVIARGFKDFGLDHEALKAALQVTREEIDRSIRNRAIRDDVDFDDGGQISMLPAFAF